MKIRRIGILALFILAALSLTFVQTGVSQAVEDNQVDIYYFWGEGCPYCIIAKPVLEELADQYTQVNLHAFEVYNDAENLQFFFDLSEVYGIEPRGVPTIFIADQSWIGFSEQTEAQIEDLIENCLVTSCEDPGKELVVQFVGQDENSEPLPTPVEITPTVALVTPTPTQEPENSTLLSEAGQSDNNDRDSSDGVGVTVPLIGEINLSGQSLLVSTLIISFVDGFNPCSLWVLSILLSITLQTRSRKKVLVVGTAFLITTALLYGLFIAGVFSVLRMISFIGWIQVVVALIALGFALVNIKDYFWYKEGISFTISDDKKPGIYQRMRGIIRNSDSYWQLIGATVVFAGGIALIELTCTAGFPVIWSNLLASQNVDMLTFVLLLLVYMLVYLLDEMIIFLAAVFTLRASKLEEKHGRVLKLIGGILMLTLAVVMLVDPSIMNDIAGSLVIFGIALGLTGLILLVDRVILPKISPSE